MNRITLRFRPIAPKPACGEASSASSELEKRDEAVKNGKITKRKYVRARNRQSKRKIRQGAEKSGIEDDENNPLEKGILTLQLMPVRSESTDISRNNSGTKVRDNFNIDRYKVDDAVNFKSVDSGGGGIDKASFRSFRSVIETWIIVECVTDTYTNAVLGLGLSDNEKINNLQLDNCPGFISDSKNNVVWVNEAYRRMVSENEFTVGLTVKEKLPYFCPSFACRVKLSQPTGHRHKWNRIVPCDVWRMEFAGFAWKLDVNTALGLSL